MKKKLEQLAREHMVVICCECKAIKVDSATWLHETEAHKRGLHHEYLEVHTKVEKKSHGYCGVCYDVALKKSDEVSIGYKSQKKYGLSKL
jgi:hypothetical protein